MSAVTPMMLVLNIYFTRAPPTSWSRIASRPTPPVPIAVLSGWLWQLVHPSRCPGGSDQDCQFRHRQDTGGRPGPGTDRRNGIRAGVLGALVVFSSQTAYCDTERTLPDCLEHVRLCEPGWARAMQAICDFVHGHVSFGYEHAAVHERPGITIMRRARRMPDFALAIALCRWRTFRRAIARAISATSAHRRPTRRWTSPRRLVRGGISAGAGIPSIPQPRTRASGGC